MHRHHVTSPCPSRAMKIFGCYWRSPAPRISPKSPLRIEIIVATSRKSRKKLAGGPLRGSARQQSAGFSVRNMTYDDLCGIPLLSGKLPVAWRQACRFRCKFFSSRHSLYHVRCRHLGIHGTHVGRFRLCRHFLDYQDLPFAPPAAPPRWRYAGFRVVLSSGARTKWDGGWSFRWRQLFPGASRKASVTACRARSGG